MKLVQLMYEGINDLTHFTRSSNNKDMAIAFKYGVCNHCGNDANDGAITMSVEDAKALGLEETEELPPDLTVDEEGQVICRHCVEDRDQIGNEPDPFASTL